MCEADWVGVYLGGYFVAPGVLGWHGEYPKLGVWICCCGKFLMICPVNQDHSEGLIAIAAAISAFSSSIVWLPS